MGEIKECGSCGKDAICEWCGDSPFDCVNDLANQLQTQLEKAEKVLEFYANDKDGEVWELDESSCEYIASITIEDTDDRKIGGKRARQYFQDKAKGL